MSNPLINKNEYSAIEDIIQDYISGAISGRSDDMKPAFHDDATIFGFVGPDLLSGAIQKLYDWNDENGPATELKARITYIDIINTVATVRLELNNWTGNRFTDLFTLLKIDGEWKITNKVFHLHA